MVWIGILETVGI